MENSAVSSNTFNKSISESVNPLLNSSLYENSPERKAKEAQSSNSELEYMKGAKIGSGEIGEVYSGISSVTGNFFAIKEIVLPLEEENSPKQKSDLIETVEFLRSLEHVNLIQYYAVQQDPFNEARICIISEVSNGESLENLIKKFGVLEEKLIRQYIFQVLEGIEYLHSQGIIHGNLKPSNILIEGDGNVKMSDYLYPSIFYGSSGQELANYFLSSKEPSNNIAPESVNGDGTLTTATDIWSVGCLIISMSTGKPVWDNLSKTKKEVLDIISSTEVPPKYPAVLSKKLKLLLNLCFERDPKRRATAKELLKHRYFKGQHRAIKSAKSILLLPPSKQASRLNITKGRMIKNSLRILTQTSHKMNSQENTLIHNLSGREEFSISGNSGQSADIDAERNFLNITVSDN